MSQTVRALARLSIGVMLLSGCALQKGQPELKAPAVPFITKETGRLTIERQEFLNVWASTQVLYAKWMLLEKERCTQMYGAGTGTEKVCLNRLAEVHEEAKLMYLSVEAKLRNPEAQVDWENVAKILGLIAKFVL